MRKRFISGLTAVCMLGILLANSFLSVPASAVIAEVGASVAAGLLMGTLFNQMTGGTGYDFTDAFSDCFSFATKPHDQYIRDNPDADIYLPDGTPYYVDGQYVTGIDLKKGEAEIAARIQSHWNIAESLGIKTPQETIHAAVQALNNGIADGSIVIHVDDNGNISMPTRSWCNSVSDTYYNLGVYTDKNGTNRVQTYYTLLSDYIYTNYNSWDIISNAPAQCELSLYNTVSTGRRVRFVPYFIADDELNILRFSIGSSTNSVYFNSSGNTFTNSVNYPLSYDKELWSTYYDNLQDFLLTSSTSISLNDSVTSVNYSVAAGITWAMSSQATVSIDSSLQSSYSQKSVTDYKDIQARGFVVVADKDYVKFQEAAKKGSIDQKKENVSIPLTGVETTIGNMGLAGVGSGATKGTVSVDSKTKEITVTNEATKEAELVIEQSKPGDIDIPDSDTIIDKFPFSLPFDLYRLLTIFVAEEKKPIFTVPIKTSFGWSDIEVNVDESFTLDFTQFQIGGVDIVQCLIRTSFYVLFVSFLIKITPKLILK